MPGDKFGTGITSTLRKGLVVESQGLMMCSEVQRHANNLNRKPKTLDADLVLHWGQRKRPRLVKGASEKPANNLDKVTSISEKALQCKNSLSVRWQPDVHNARLARQGCASFATDTESRLMKGPTEDPTSLVDLTQRGNTPADSLAQIVSNAVSDLERQFFSQKKRENGFGNLTGGRDSQNANNHRRTEVESLQGGPNTFGFFRWPKVLVSLSWKEKEDDFMAIKGSKLPQRPKRHPKKVEKTLQYISPGAFLCELTRDRYEVREEKSLKKKQRGLKAMDGVETDSD